MNIVIPTINRKDLLLELLTNINTQLEQFDKLLIIDNGNQDIMPDINNWELVNQNKVEIYLPGKNLGVSGSWNYGINIFRNSGHILFINDDVVIGNNQLNQVNEFLSNHIFWLLTGNSLWSMFTMSKECWEYFLQKDGYVFDENFFPAYFEDNDMHYRIQLAYEVIYNQHIQYPNEFHAGAIEMNPEIFRNSMTINKDSSLNNNFGKNERYYIQKWGGRPGHERFRTPFGK